jgi:hypothetical protein
MFPARVYPSLSFKATVASKKWRHPFSSHIGSKLKLKRKRKITGS